MKRINQSAHHAVNYALLRFIEQLDKDDKDIQDIKLRLTFKVDEETEHVSCEIEEEK